MASTHTPRIGDPRVASRNNPTRPYTPPVSTRANIAIAMGIGVATLAFAAWIFMRFTRGVIPIPWGLFALIAVALVIVLIIAIPFSRWLHSPWNATRAGAFFRSARGRVIWGLCLATLFLAAMYAIRGRGSLVAAFAQHAPMATMFAGFGFIGAGRTREGTTPRCAKCEYDLSGAPDRADPADKCPECGALFRKGRGMVTGTKTTHPRLIAAGVVLIAVPFIFLAITLGWYVPYLPTASLIAEVSGAPRGFTMDEWTELGTRTLTPTQETTLARGLLDLRRRRGFLDNTAEAWIEKHALSGTMPADLLERYYGEWLDLWLVAPDSAKVGEWITFGLSSQYRGSIPSPTTGTTLRAVVVGEELSLGTDEVGRSSEAMYGLRLQPDEVYEYRRKGRARPQALADRSPRARFQVQTPGEHRIRAAAWIVITGSSPGEISWSSDGRPVVPLSVWSRRVELERTVRVNP